MYTNGVRGGYYAFKDHVFPFEIALPLPVIGSILAQFRSQGGISVQDRFNEKYNALMKRLKTIVFNNDNLVFYQGMNTIYNTLNQEKSSKLYLVQAQWHPHLHWD